MGGKAALPLLEGTDWGGPDSRLLSAAAYEGIVATCVQERKQQQAKLPSGRGAQPLTLANFDDDDSMGNNGRAIFRF